MTTGRVLGCRHRFVGRERELERLTTAARKGRSLVLSGKAGSGVSQLMRQAFDRLFFAGEILPIHFECRSGEDQADASRRFVRDAVICSVAFRRGDASLIAVAPTLEEAASQAVPSDAPWIDHLLEAMNSADDSEIAELGFAIPARIAAGGTKVAVFVDDLNASSSLVNAVERSIKLADTTLIVRGPVALADRLKLPKLSVERLAVPVAAQLVEAIAEDAGVQTTERTRDLIAVQLEGHPRDIFDLILEAADLEVDLVDFKAVEQVYTRSLIEGRLGRGRGDQGLVARDIVDAAPKLRDKRRTKAAVIADLTVANFARAPRLMTEYYRSEAAIGVKKILNRLYGQSVPRALISYGMFKEQFKGQAEEMIITTLSGSTEQFELPRIVHAASAVEFYPALGELSDRDRSALGLTGAGEAWVMAEIDSKLEADASTTEFWCDRLEMVALNAGYPRFRLWLVAPEGFDDEAREVLADRNAIGTSRQQTHLLKKLLDDPPQAPDVATTYEMTVPMGEEGELTASRTVDEIAAKHAIPAKIAMQVKTALVEALINAAEHSLSPDRRVETRFTVDDSQLTITVTNRGLRLEDKQPSEPEGTRRGWGLKLMEKLMDEVSLEPTDDGTRLVMIKLLGQESSR